MKREKKLFIWKRLRNEVRGKREENNNNYIIILFKQDPWNTCATIDHPLPRKRKTLNFFPLQTFSPLPPPAIQPSYPLRRQPTTRAASLCKSFILNHFLVSHHFPSLTACSHLCFVSSVVHDRAGSQRASTVFRRVVSLSSRRRVSSISQTLELSVTEVVFLSRPLSLAVSNRQAEPRPS